MTYGVLADLIKRRNELVHSKSFFVDARTWTMSLPKSCSMRLLWRRRSLSSECGQFYAALQALDAPSLYPLERGDLAPNSLIRAR